ncbi:vacuolar membrane PQ loop repeat protein [Cladophialophora carrionii]|uniref:Vacuolar membrane PQ loop repeat protein n=1 Tax=Cladophialophora carrionii TaxID=86049 RepID=A0A1C1CUK0_9EURO|nr:vacuolar membrane PQ loop repeat protein [Cladophialophora carrionii]
MATLVTALVTPSTYDIPLTTREALSGIFGSISLACWIFLLVPQLIENYRNSSAEAISLAFIFVWFLGDIANLAGALWAGLVPVVVAIGVYFCIADGVLIGQCLYYGLRNKRREGKALLRRESLVGSSSSAAQGDGHAQVRPSEEEEEESHEQEPLLKRSRTNSMTIPGSMDRRRSSASLRRRRSSLAAQNDHLAKILEERDASGTTLWFKNAMSVIAIGVIGTAGWALAYESGAWKPSPMSTGPEGEAMPAGALVLGYFSAVAYLGARIPQIIKNARDRSCEGKWLVTFVPLYCIAAYTLPGLSLLFFILSLMGNLTYGAGILCHSTERQYVLKNLPWLIGSLGTMVEDVTIFAQFHIYSVQGKEARPEHAVI